MANYTVEFDATELTRAKRVYQYYRYHELGETGAIDKTDTEVVQWMLDSGLTKYVAKSAIRFGIQDEECCESGFENIVDNEMPDTYS